MLPFIIISANKIKSNKNTFIKSNNFFISNIKEQN